MFQVGGVYSTQDALNQVISRGQALTGANIINQQDRLAAMERDARIAANLSGQGNIQGNGMAQQDLAWNKGYNLS